MMRGQRAQDRGYTRGSRGNPHEQSTGARIMGGKPMRPDHHRGQVIAACTFLLGTSSASGAWVSSVDRSPMDEKEKLTLMTLAKKDPLREKLRQLTPIFFITCS